MAAGPLLDERPTAVYCDDDLIAAGLYLAARERGIRLPRDLSVVGFDDMDFARALEPALTTVVLDAELLGATAFELLERRMAGKPDPAADSAAGGAARARLDGAAPRRRAPQGLTAAQISDYGQRMDPAMVARVRRFNRLVTQRVGALDDRFLARGRPLGEARLLWEIGPEGCELRRLRERLDLDSGYLSRLLRNLEEDGLVTVGPAERDRRCADGAPHRLGPA